VLQLPVDNPRAIDYDFSGGTVFLHTVHTPYDDIRFSSLRNTSRTIRSRG